jgi:hypothetical protein
MDRNFVKAVRFAWDRPEFKAGLRHLVDLDEVTTLLAALAVDDPDHGHDPEVEVRVMHLVRSALETEEIRQAVLLLIEADDVRHSLVAGIADSLADRPGLARAIGAALEDPATLAEIRDVLESPALRAVIWKVVESRRARVLQVAVLLVQHRPARRLVWALRRHGVLRELRRR